MKNLSVNCCSVGTIIFAMTTFFFAACGGDSDSPSKVADKDDGREVATVVDMGRCTNEREGDTVYVAEKMKDYLCRNRTWVDLSEISDSESSRSSSSVVTDKTSATSGKSSSSSVASNTSSATSNASAVSSSSNKIDSPQDFIRENISVTGVAQKGPFKFGSPLNLSELKNDLTPSGRVYKDEINSNKGDFVIPKVSLAYPYAKLEVRGLYRNEVTGEWSKDSMTLRALTDFSDKRAETNSNDRVQVNINLLTHLEYDRALYLVQEKGYSVFAAKKQAAQEIMTAFEFATAVTYSEDFAIFQNDGVGSGTIAGNGTLLAISALVMGNRSDAEIQSVVDKFREDIKTDGEWNDLQTKADMADWAYNFKYSNIRASVKSWNILDIPDYETYLDVYWNNVYGLGGCSAIRKGIVATNSNELSKYFGEYFICNSSAWVAATTYQKDTYEWDDGKNGEFKKGNVTDSIYVFNGSKWDFSERETVIGICQKGNAGVVSKYNNVHYICRDNAWEKATMLEFDTYGLTGVEGDVKAGVVNTSYYYIYKDGKWQSATSVEKDLGGCVASREGEVGESGVLYYICKSEAWVRATALEYDTYGLKCVEGEVRAGLVNKVWYYICKDGKWQTATNEEQALGGCTVSREGKFGVIGDSYYICKSKTWKYATRIEYDLGECVASREGVVGKSEDIYYICKSNIWMEATVLEYDTYGLTGIEGDVKAGVVNKDKYYVYENGSWLQYIVNPSTVVMGTWTDSRDNQTYKTVQIGTQTWMAENMNYNTTDSYCFRDSSKYCAKYGRLYTWAAAKTICPGDWYLPTKTKFKELFAMVSRDDTAGKMLKSASGWNDGGNGTDDYSFSALPVGTSFGVHGSYGDHATFWSSTEKDSKYAYSMSLYHDYDGAGLSANLKSIGYSVRCVKMTSPKGMPLP